MKSEIEHRPDALVIRVLDREATARTGAGTFLWDALDVVGNGNNGAVALDLAAVCYIDSSMINSVLKLHRHLKLEGRRMRLEGVRPLVQTMLQMAGTGEITPETFVEPHTVVEPKQNPVASKQAREMR